MTDTKLFPSKTQRGFSVASKGVVQVRISKPSQKCPKQWQKFLADDLNKREFIRVLHAEWQSIGYATVLEGKELFLTVDEECHRLTSLGDSMQDEKITALYTDQE